MLYYFNYKRLYNKEVQYKRKYIVEFLFFLVLYLFYNANLLKICNNIKLQVSVTSFVNNVNILTYKKLIKRNCKMLS